MARAVYEDYDEEDLEEAQAVAAVAAWAASDEKQLQSKAAQMLGVHQVCNWTKLPRCADKSRAWTQDVKQLISAWEAVMSGVPCNQQDVRDVSGQTAT